MNFLPYIAVYNVVVLLIYGLDKLLAKLKTRRIPERLLLALALFCASFGALSGMVLFHHKISKPRFRYTISFLFILQAGIFMWLQLSGVIR